MLLSDVLTGGMSGVEVARDRPARRPDERQLRWAQYRKVIRALSTYPLKLERSLNQEIHGVDSPGIRAMKFSRSDVHHIMTISKT